MSTTLAVPVTTSPPPTCLTDAQVAEIKAEMVALGTPVRFQRHGCTMDIITGHCQPLGINVIHQIAYWRFTKETSKKIAKWLNVKAVFDGE